MRALVLGGVSWNIIVRLDRLPGAVPRTIHALGSHEAIGSSGAGKALNLARLGWDVTLWAAIGDDEAGGRIRSVLAREPITLLEETDPAGTMRHLNLMDRIGERISIFLNAGSSELPIDHHSLRGEMERADLVCVTIFDHCRGFLPVAASAGVPLWIDIHDYDGVAGHHRDFIAAARYLQLSSTNLPGWRSFAESQLASGKELVLCTHGQAGASLLTGGGWTEIRPRPVEPVDGDGAGDAFTAGFVTAWWSRPDPASALELGSSTARRCLLSVGLAPDPD